MTLHALKARTRKHENYAKGTKQDVHLWRETVLFYLIMSLQQGN